METKIFSCKSCIRRLNQLKKVAFIKFRNFIKNVFSKINKDSIYKYKQKATTDTGFNNYKKYLVDYEYKKYEPKIWKKNLSLGVES